MNGRALRMARSHGLDTNADPVRVGKLVEIDEHGRPIVIIGEGEPPIVARVCMLDPPPSAAELTDSLPVLLMLEQGDPSRPIIIGVIRDSFTTTRSNVPVSGSDRSSPIELNGKALIFQGDEEIVLRCGQGSLTIRANGQIVVKGTRVVSRASESNKIRGASVEIN
jgi:hypothetical protein